MNRQLAAGSRRRLGVLALLSSALSNQSGAAVGSLAFPLIGPVGVVAVRQFVAAAVLIPTARPHVRALTWQQWWPILLLAVVFGSMNLGLYLAIERIGLGLAVTLEFLGPLVIALAGTRNWKGIGLAAAAATGLVIIARPEPSTDFLGVGLALMAAGSWAAYILLNRTVGRRVPGLAGTAAATGVSAALFVPIGLVVFLHNPPTIAAILYACAAGVFASAVPYVADLIALRHVPAHLFGMLMSINPVFAAIIGAAFLGEAFGAAEWAAIFLIVAANACALTRKALPVASENAYQPPSDQPARQR